MNIEKTQTSPIADLASELGVEIEALEERLEMVAALEACCIINGSHCTTTTK